MNRLRFFSFLVLLSTVLSALLPSHAGAVENVRESEPMQGGIFTEDLTVPGNSLPEGAPLSLEEATGLALIRNLDIRRSKWDLLRERQKVREVAGVYDINLDVNATYFFDKAQRASIVLGDREIEGAVNIALEKKIPLGTVIGLEGESRRISTNTAFSTFPRYYTSLGKVSVRQPLLRDFFGYIDRKKIEQAKLDVLQYDYRTLDQIEQSIADVRTQYWDLVFAYKDLENRKDALRKAQDFFKITRDKLDLGLTERPDVYAAEANVRTRVMEVLEAENHLRQESWGMKVLLDRPEVELIIPDEEPPFESVPVHVESAILAAMEKRRDLKQLVLELERQNIEVKIKKNETLPQLDIEGSYAGSSLDRDLAPSQGEVFGFNHPQYYAGVNFSMKLENREKRSQRDQETLKLRMVEEDLRKLHLVIAQEVDKAARYLLWTEANVEQTRQVQQLQNKKLKEEEKNFNLGRSNSKTIIDYQEDLIRAKTEAIRAIADHGKALDAYRLAGNFLLDSLKITEIDPPQAN